MEEKKSDMNMNENKDDNDPVNEEEIAKKKPSKSSSEEQNMSVITTEPKNETKLVYATSQPRSRIIPGLTRPIAGPPRPPMYYSRAYPGQFGQPLGGPPLMHFQNPIMDFSYWAPYPESVPPGIPPGLAHLLAADTILIMQQVNMMELFMSTEQTCTFMVLNPEGLCIFYAYETSFPFARYCCGDNRPLQIHVKDMYQNEIIYMNKKCSWSKCPALCQCCCLTAMEVYSIPLTPIGAVVGHNVPGSIILDIVDVDENVLFHVRQEAGLICIYCLLNTEFAITLPNSRMTEVGLIRKQWGGLFREYLSSAEVFTVNFPADLDVKIKALFISAMFLINYVYYE